MKMKVKRKHKLIYSGDVIDSYLLSDFSRNYLQNEAGDLYDFDNAGIYAIAENGNLDQTVIDNLGFAYADPSLRRMYLLADNNKVTTYMAVCEYSEKLKVFEYSFDETASYNKAQHLEIWAFEDMPTIRAAIAVFSKENPDCEVSFEIGKSGEDSELTNEDVIRNLNTKLLAGDSPDVLFLDGLSIDAFHKQGILSDIDIDLVQTKRMVDSQNMNAEPSDSMLMSSSTVSVEITTTPSLFEFQIGKASYGTGIIMNYSFAKSLFLDKGKVEILPLLSGSYINQLIASIPNEAKNRELAQKFISILLTSTEVQTSIMPIGFPVKKEVGLQEIKKEMDQFPEEYIAYMEQYFAYDWEGLFNSLRYPCQEEYLVYDIVYEQAKKLYEDETNVDVAVGQIVQRLNLLFAERN